MTTGFGEPLSSGGIVEAVGDTTAHGFASFEELKAAIEIQPTIVSTELLIQAVQSRLQRPGVHANMTDAELEEHCKTQYEIWKNIPGIEDLQKFTEAAKVGRDQHAYLKQALMKLEARLAEAASVVSREDWQARLRRCAPDDPVPSPVETSPSIEAIFSDIAAFEREHSPQVGGDAAQPVRTVLGVTLGVLIENYGVDPRNLADYVREVLRFVHPAAFK